MEAKSFQKKIWEHYKKNARHFPWRSTRNGYRILVSEIMLQQTQTDRVIPKYTSFIKKFPDFKSLAKAENFEVLKEWQGLGYNRRGLNLKRAAEMVASHFGGTLPRSLHDLESLPGIGPYTAGALTAFVYDKPAVFIETNIRTVYLHFFFPNKKKVPDDKLLDLIAETLPSKNFREWYYALMDYGVFLKKSGIRINSKSAHYNKQSTFKGSHREKRSMILKLLLKDPKLSLRKLETASGLPKETISAILDAYKKEGFIK